MGQPLIFKKQIISLIINLALVLFFIFVYEDSIYLNMAITFLYYLITITFLPSIKNKLNYSPVLHTVLFYMPFFIPILFIRVEGIAKHSLIGIISGIVIGLIHFAVTYSYNKNNILNNISYETLQVDFIYFFDQIFSFFVAIVGEEIFYRYIMIGTLKSKVGIYSIFIGAVLFVLSHYVNRWANVMFNFYSYLNHFILAIAFGLIFYYTNSILGCIIAHSICNSSELITLYKMFKGRNSKSESLFDDY